METIRRPTPRGKLGMPRGKNNVAADMITAWMVTDRNLVELLKPLISPHHSPHRLTPQQLHPISDQKDTFSKKNCCTS
jgi:hypothetical protein